jgi:PmbA protein
MIDELKEKAQSIMTCAGRRGATAADAFIHEDETFSVTVRKGEVEKLQESVSRGLRLRVFLGKRTATSQTSDLSMELLDKLVTETLEMAQLTSEDDSGGLPDAEAFPSSIPDLQLTDPLWNMMDAEQRIEWARRAERAAFEADSRITNSEGGSFEYEHSRVVLANTLGFLEGYETTSAGLQAVPIAEVNGIMQQDYWLSIARQRNQLLSPEEVGWRAASRVVRRLGARKVKTCEVPVVFDPVTSRTLVKHMFDAVSGDAVYRKRSFLAGRMNQPVASNLVTIVDDGRLAAGLGSSPFDDEGVATQVTTVVENGILRNYLHSAYTARKLNAAPTGNGSRTGGGSIGVGPTNLYMIPGRSSAEEIIASVKTGLYVVELLGFGVNTVNGNYSRGVTGLWIENGKFAFPVHEITIAGNLQQMLQDIDMVGNDLDFLGPIASPTFRVRNMTLSGE